MAQVRRIKLGSQGLEVSAQGLGCGAWSRQLDLNDEGMIDLHRHAINSGVTFLDTADAYGPFTGEILLGKALKEGFRETVQLASKFGLKVIDDKILGQGDPAFVRVSCEASLKRLNVDCIDLYYQHRVDTRVPIEITRCPVQCYHLLASAAPSTCENTFPWLSDVANVWLELKKLVEEGRIKYVGLSEASASTVRRAHSGHPITAVQLEWTLWSRDVEEEIVPTCRELGIGIVVYSPLGKGFFSLGPKLLDHFSENDLRKRLPRFQPENFEHNKLIFERMSTMAASCTPSQLALAWLHHQGDDVCPIPGTTKIKNLDQNIGALSVKLTPEEMRELESLASAYNVKGERTLMTVQTWKDSDTPPLSSWAAE